MPAAVLICCLLTCFWNFTTGAQAPVLAPTLHPPGGQLKSPVLLQLTNRNTAGTIFFTMDGSDPKDPFGRAAASARGYSDPISLRASGVVKARVKRGEIWSDLAAGAFTLDQDFTKLLITEVMYHPYDSAHEPAEFVELKNIGDKPLYLSQAELLLEGNITTAVPKGTIIPAGGFYVILAAPEGLTDYPGLTPQLFFAGYPETDLSNGADYVALRSGAIICEMEYFTHAPWQVVPDNHGYFFNGMGIQEVGFSLVRKRLDATENPKDYRSWRASSQRYGSPGRDDPETGVLPVFVNEVLSRSGEGEVDGIELYNPNDVAVNLAGWWLSRHRNWPYLYKLPVGKVIEPGGYLVVEQNEFSNETNDITLDALGDRCFLFSGNAAGELTGFSHGVEFGGAERNVSFGRIVTSDGGEHMWPQKALTFGGTNSGPKTGPLVITELHYNGGPGEPDFLELRNISAEPVALFHPNRPEATWKLGRVYPQYEELYFSFPPGITVPANGIVLVVAGDPEDFRARYAVPAEVQIVPKQPFPGWVNPWGLPNGGLHMQVLRPIRFEDNRTIYSTIDGLEYDDKAPWPVDADGGGSSLERIDFAGFGHEPRNWRLNPSGSSPGRITNFEHRTEVRVEMPPAAFVGRPAVLKGHARGLNWPEGSLKSRWVFPAPYAQYNQEGGAVNEVNVTFAATGLITAVFEAASGTNQTAQSFEVEVIERPFDQWRREHFTFGELNNPALSGEAADPDQDGLKNVAEYFFNGNPRSADAGGSPRVEVLGDEVAASWVERTPAPDAELTPELAHVVEGPWFNEPALFSRSEEALPANRKTVTLRWKIPAGSQTHFVRFGLIAR